MYRQQKGRKRGEASQLDKVINLRQKGDLFLLINLLHYSLIDKFIFIIVNPNMIVTIPISTALNCICKPCVPLLLTGSYGY